MPFTLTTWHRLEHTWQQLGFWANSLIFLLAAMLVLERLVLALASEELIQPSAGLLSAQYAMEL